MSIPSRVQLIDVGPRDGLQNEKQPVPAAVKIELVHRLQAAGLTEIEVTSYVSPKWVPQMADNHEVMGGITRGFTARVWADCADFGLVVVVAAQTACGATALRGRSVAITRYTPPPMTTPKNQP